MAYRFHQIIVFEDANFEGSHKHIFQGMNLDEGWANQISSFAVESGFWRFDYYANGKQVCCCPMASPRPVFWTRSNSTLR